MQRHLDLIKTDYKEVEKRIFPRFPYSYLNFKSEGLKTVFEVKDISPTGMQLALRNGGHNFCVGDNILGKLQWYTKGIEINGNVKWVTANRIGVSFSNKDTFDQSIRNFLSLENIVLGMRPLHQHQLDLEVPGNLKYWLRADGPVEIFVWSHNDGDLSQFQIIYMQSFVEWNNGKGVKTGKVLTKRDLETPLVTEDEFLFQIDESVDQLKVKKALNLIEFIPKDYLDEKTFDFLLLKLGKTMA